MFFLPTRNRPERLQQALDKITEAGTQSAGLIVIDGEDPSKYDNIRLPDNWSFKFLPNDLGGVARVWNWCVDNYPDLPWYGMITDDLHVRTKEWDVKLIEAAGSKNIASANDLWQANENVALGRMQGAVVFGGDLIRTVGYWAPRGMIHNFVDDLWENIGRGFNCWRVLIDVITEHMHPAVGKSGLDETYARNMQVVDGRLNFATATMQADTKTWARWTDCERPLVFDRLTKFFSKMPEWQVNINGAKVAILTPAHDNNVTTQFLQSWTSTIKSLLMCHAEFPTLITLPGESLLMRARNNLIYAFLHTTDCEYALFIDADMGWDGDSVAKLIALAKSGKLVVGAAGPRKMEPPSYCARLVGPVLQPDPMTGCLRATELGTGFLMIHRSVIERMIQAYPHLCYDDDGRRVYALFDTSIVGGKLFSEDYTFMHRASECGFEVWVDPSIHLLHVGNKVYQGRLLDAITKQAPEDQKVA